MDIFINVGWATLCTIIIISPIVIYKIRNSRRRILVHAKPSRKSKVGRTIVYNSPARTHSGSGETVIRKIK